VPGEKRFQVLNRALAAYPDRVASASFDGDRRQALFRGSRNRSPRGIFVGTHVDNRLVDDSLVRGCLFFLKISSPFAGNLDRVQFGPDLEGHRIPVLQ
jgi:hypothetical protein